MEFRNWVGNTKGRRISTRGGVRLGMIRDEDRWIGLDWIGNRNPGKACESRRFYEESGRRI
jgi:hypothetical protein